MRIVREHRLPESVGWGFVAAIVVLCLLSLLAGCAGTDDDDVDEYSGDGALSEVNSDYGQLEAPLISETVTGGGTVVGTSDINLGGGPAACSAVINSTCFVPKTRNTTFCLEPNGWGSIGERLAVFNALAPNLTAMVNQLAQVPPIAGEPSNWTITLLPLGTVCNEAVMARVVKGTLPNSGDSMDGYVRVNFLTLQTLDEGLPGLWKTFEGARITLDSIDIVARGANNFEDERLLQRALAKGAAAVLGAGNSFGHVGVATQGNVGTIGGYNEFTAGQACRLNRFKVGPSIPGYRVVTSNPPCAFD